MLAKAEAKHLYSKLEQCFFGIGKFPEKYKNVFDITIASGIFTYGHASPAGIEDMFEGLKTNGIAIFTVPDDESLGYQEKLEEKVEKG